MSASQAPSPLPLDAINAAAANDDALRDTETHIATAESQVSREMDTLTRRGEAAAKRFMALQDAVSQRYVEGCEDESFLELMRRCQSTQPPAMAVERHWEESHKARAEAVAARQRCLEAMLHASDEFKAAIVALEKQIDDDEHHFSKMRFEETRRPATQAPPPPALIAPAPTDEVPKPEVPTLTPLAPSPTPDGGERRQQQRVALEAVVGFESENNFYTGFSADISEGGLFVSTVNTVPVGSVVHLGFTLPNGYRANIEGEVRWVRDYNDMTPQLHPGMGIQFRSLPEEVKAKLTGFINAREPLFYDMD